MASFSDPVNSTRAALLRCGPSSHRNTVHSISIRSASNRVTRRFGIDSSVLVQLLTHEPEARFEFCVTKLSALVGDEAAEIFESKQVICEAYIAVQHHYGVSKSDAREGLLEALRSGLVAPLNGEAVLAALEGFGGTGLFDRLITDEYLRRGQQVLTLENRMAALPDVWRLREGPGRRL